MKLLILVNGNARKILSTNNLSQNEFEIAKIDEKDLSSPRRIFNIIGKKYEEIYYGCISIDYQRFIPFMLIYLLFSKSKKGGILDEEGKILRFSPIKIFFLTIPGLFLELIFSFFIVNFSYIYYFIWRKFKTSN